MLCCIELALRQLEDRKRSTQGNSGGWDETILPLLARAVALSVTSRWDHASQTAAVMGSWPFLLRTP